FQDNYIWLLLADGQTSVTVVDPGDADPVIAELEARGLDLDSILITHHHADHTGGLEQLCQRYQPTVYGPENPGIALIDVRVTEGDTVTVQGLEFEVLTVPGHTLDHIAFHTPASADRPGALFCGDTLFAGGCGRLFEGSPAQ